MKIAFTTIPPAKNSMGTMLKLLQGLSGTRTYTLAFTPHKQLINMGEYSYSTASTDPLLKAYGVVTCIALAVYSKETKEGALAHIIFADPLVKEHLQAVRARFKSNDFEIKIISPQADRDFREETAAAVREVFGIAVELGHMDSKAASYDVELNLADGSLLVSSHC